MTLREALAEILTPPVLAARLREGIETEYLVAEALVRIGAAGGHGPAETALLAWCRRYAAVWLLEDGDRRLEGPPENKKSPEL